MCTDVGQSAAVVNQESGWLVPPEQPEMLAEKIWYALSHTDEAAQKANRLHKHVQQFFSETSAMNVLLRVYNAIVKT